MPILPGSINLWAVLSLSPYVSMRRKPLHSTLRSHSQHRCLQLLPPRQPFEVAPLCCHLWVERFCCPFSKILRKQSQTFNKQASTHPLRIYWWGLTQETEPEINVCNSFATCQHIGVVVIRCGSWYLILTWWRFRGLVFHLRHLRIRRSDRWHLV